jgi:hypothetical protein
MCGRRYLIRKVIDRIPDPSRLILITENFSFPDPKILRGNRRKRKTTDGGVQIHAPSDPSLVQIFLNQLVIEDKDSKVGAVWTLEETKYALGLF